MFLRDGHMVTSASDLTAASKCEFAFLRALDAKLGRIAPVPDPDDAMRERAAHLGDRHEALTLQRYREQFGSGVVEITRPDVRDPVGVQSAVEHTKAAFDSGAAVVFQAAFARDDFVGFADFIVRRPDCSYLVQDTKLARRARVTALLQLAAYAEQLDLLGIPRANTVELLLGDGTVSEHRVADILPVYRLRRRRLQQIVAERMADNAPVTWGDPRYGIDGHCPTCDLEITERRDVLLVAGMRLPQRAALRAAGITTITELATGAGPVDGIATATLEGLRIQARLQLDAEQPAGTDAAPLPPIRIRDPHALSAIPEPNPGDLFFDFEGDPLYTEGEGTVWGLDYLFGLTDNADAYTPLWAHTFAEERTALLRFLTLVAKRRQRYPDMHIYHYASYERSHLLAMAARHGIGEAEIDQLLSDGVLVDLYPIVKHAVRVGSRSYSIKKLEPLYMGGQLRTSDVTTGGDSIVQYVHARELEATGHTDLATGLSGEEAARAILADIADYNRYDCVSTRRLRDWLLQLAGRERIAPAPRLEEISDRTYRTTQLAQQLFQLATTQPQGGNLSDQGGRTPDQTALALAATAIDYHDREQKSFWWGHFFRLEQPVEEWEHNRDVLIADPGGVRVIQPWFREEAQRRDRRQLALRGQIAPGSRLTVGTRCFVLYDPPAPFLRQGWRPGNRTPSAVEILEVYSDGVLVEEICPGDEPWEQLPIAVVPGPPPNAGAQRSAIAEWATQLLESTPVWPQDAVTDILRRQPAHTREPLPPVVESDYLDATVRAVLALENSYLAVQGPPGTGKTYLAAHVIARLVLKHGWKIGVVAQSHAVVEHLLDQVVAAGLPGKLAGKAPKNPDDPDEHEYTILAKNTIANFCAQHAANGFVVGGTAWDFSNLSRFGRQSLDLLVIDEAGQFSLAATIAVSVAARNLLLLGDPSQLPQVSQGVHPEPVDTSALGWLTDGHDVLPSPFGYFLAESRRMHPALAAAVSGLAYEGELRSHRVAQARSLTGIPAGLIPVPVVHSGSSTESVVEADRVVALVTEVLGRPWREVQEKDGTITALPERQLGEQDLIVVTPYNAQLALIRERLDSAGLDAVPVGTVDKFQGREAAVAIVSLAASSALDAARGLEFLLLKNRLNVAISRAKWAAYLVYSPALLDHLPHTPEGVARLSGFARLIGEKPPNARC